MLHLQKRIDALVGVGTCAELSESYKIEVTNLFLIYTNKSCMQKRIDTLLKIGTFDSNYLHLLNYYKRLELESDLFYLQNYNFIAKKANFKKHEVNCKVEKAAKLSKKQLSKREIREILTTLRFVNNSKGGKLTDIYNTLKSREKEVDVAKSKEWNKDIKSVYVRDASDKVFKYIDFLCFVHFKNYSQNDDLSILEDLAQDLKLFYLQRQKKWNSGLNSLNFRLSTNYSIVTYAKRRDYTLNFKGQNAISLFFGFS